MDDVIENPKIGRSPLIAFLITLFLGIFLGYMYAGFLKRGIKLILLQLLIIILAMLLMNFNIFAGIALLASVIPFMIYVFVDVIRISRVGTLQSFHKWYYYLTAVILLQIAGSIVSFIIKASILQAFLLPTTSMEPGIIPGDRVMGGVLAARMSEPKRGDIIAFRPPTGMGDNKGIFAKRVVAVGGDSIEIRDGLVLVNDKPEKTVSGVKKSSNGEFLRDRVPDNHYFVLGDNRTNSYDSSKWENPYVPRKNVRAILLFRFWPLSRFGVVR